MFEKIIPLDSNLHAGKRFRKNIGFSFAEQQHLAIIALHEFPKIAGNYPILFIKKPQDGKFAPVALLGVEPNENLFVNADGTWQQDAFIPSAFQRYPFVLVKAENDSMTVWMDDIPELFDAENGVELFSPDGVETEFLIKSKEFLVGLLKSEMLTAIFCEKLVELDLLVPGSLDIRIGADVKQFSGCFVVDEKRLNALSSAAFESLREHGFMGLIYAHLLSINLIERVVARKVASIARNKETQATSLP
jgi:hypothetical protein